MDPDHTLQLVDARRLHHALRVESLLGGLAFRGFHKDATSREWRARPHIHLAR